MRVHMRVRVYLCVLTLCFWCWRGYCVRSAMQVPKETSPEKKARVAKLAKVSNERRLKEKKFRSEKLKNRRSSKRDGW